MLEENIRVMRREKGLTQEQLAEVMGVSTASVSKWETGVAAPELTMLAALADYFEMSIDALIGHTVDKAQLEEKVAAIKELSLANEDDKAMELTCHFALAFMEQEEENMDAAKEHIRQAVRAELDKDLPEDDSKMFIKTENPHKIIHTEFSGTCQVVQWLTAMGEEELLAVAKEELK